MNLRPPGYEETISIFVTYCELSDIAVLWLNVAVYRRLISYHLCVIYRFFLPLFTPIVGTKLIRNLPSNIRPPGYALVFPSFSMERSASNRCFYIASLSLKEYPLFNTTVWGQKTVYRISPIDRFPDLFMCISNTATVTSL